MGRLSVGVFALFAAIALAMHRLAAAEEDRAKTEERTVWREFVATLRAGPFPPDRIRPYLESMREPLLGFLGQMRAEADWREWEAAPETFRVGKQIHFVLPLTFTEGKKTFCFSFLVEDGRWYLQHMESIVIRMDRLGPLPLSSFPDVPDATKAWIRAEWEATREVWLYGRLAAEKGPAAALDWFRDGPGYALTAHTWVPFVSPERSFVLYLCWEQANLRGNEVTLESLGEEEAVIRIKPLWFLLYDRTAHLRQQISRQAYRKLFEAKWTDRATAAGWNIEFSYDGDFCRFRLRCRRAPSPAR